MSNVSILQEVKTCRQSRAIQSHRILPFVCNMHDTLYGGKLMEMIDNCASISASRHCRSLTVTASMDSMNFIKPLPLSDSVAIESIVTGTGKTSVEIFVKVIGENLETGHRYLAATAFLTFVTVPDEAGQPVYVAQIKGETPEELFVCSGYQERRQARLAAVSKNIDFNNNISMDIPW